MPAAARGRRVLRAGATQARETGTGGKRAGLREDREKEAGGRMSDGARHQEKEGLSESIRDYPSLSVHQEKEERGKRSGDNTGDRASLSESIRVMTI